MVAFHTIAYSFVIADLFHYGHLNILKTAKECADYHICGLVSDKACHLWQGVNICNFDERKAVLEDLKCVDSVIEQESMDPTDNLRKIKDQYPNAKIILVHGSDWSEIPGRDYLESIGGEIVRPEYYKRLSRESIIKNFQAKTARTPLSHEQYTHHFRVGDLVQFNTSSASPLMSTKANTLKSFGSILKLSKIEPMFIFNVEEFVKLKPKILEEIQAKFPATTLIIRSSSSQEDTYVRSCAGQYVSVKNVHSGSAEDLEMAIVRVIESYHVEGQDGLNHQVLVQRQTIDVKMSGVIFTKNIRTNTPYYVLEFDDISGKTDTITGGLHSNSITFYKYINIEDYPAEWRKLILAIKEVESHLPGMILDIEFGMDHKDNIYIYQIRPLAANVRCDDSVDSIVKGLIQKNLKKFQEEKEAINQSTLFLSDMAFWNPSEIIGDNPKNLDYSLYEEIITHTAWNEGLIPLGYTQVPFSLMTRYGNKPYINLDYAFYALMPALLSPEIKRKLCEFYKCKLKRDTTSHDKIEFEIVISAFDPHTPEKLRELRENGFTDAETKEILNCVLNLTRESILRYRDFLNEDLQSLKRLSGHYHDALEEMENKPSVFQGIKLFLGLISQVKTLGTPQFSRMARLAFISKAICRGMMNQEILTEKEYGDFFEKVPTVASELSRDALRFNSGEISKEDFLGKYGHLRAGTYDITSPRYDQMDFLELGSRMRVPVSENAAPCDYSQLAKNQKLLAYLDQSLLGDINRKDVFLFLQDSIQQREFFKYEFTKSLSLALEVLGYVGNQLKFSRGDLAFLDIASIQAFQFCKGERELTAFWEDVIERRKGNYESSSLLVLPPILQRKEDFFVIRSINERPNFISNLSIEGQVVNLDIAPDEDITHKIVLIRRADPGYDWIFLKNISGLVTQYGGVASHMAIRCAEFGLPAAIGCGEELFKKICAWKFVKLDCSKKKINEVIC